MRRVRSARRAALTTSCDVMPAGLSMSSMPSIGRPSAPRRILLFGTRIVGWPRVVDLRQQRFDARGVRHALIEVELDLGRQPQTKRATDAGAQMARHAGETVERRGALGVAPEDADENLRVPQISRHVDA